VNSIQRQTLLFKLINVSGIKLFHDKEVEFYLPTFATSCFARASYITLLWLRTIVSCHAIRPQFADITKL